MPEKLVKIMIKDCPWSVRQEFKNALGRETMRKGEYVGMSEKIIELIRLYNKTAENGG